MSIESQYDPYQINYWIKANYQDTVTSWIALECTSERHDRMATPEENVSCAFKTSQESGVKNKIARGTLFLLDSTDWTIINKTDLGYFTNLLKVASSIQEDSRIHNKLVELAKDQTLKQVQTENGSLHGKLLFNLGFINNDPRVERIYKRSIYESEYAPLSYRMLWKHDPKYATKYAWLIRGHSLKDDHFPKNELFTEVNNKLGLSLS